MMPIFGVDPGAVRPLAAEEKLPEAPRVQKPGQDARSRPPQPVADEYLPEEKQKPFGLYRMGRDEDGRPRIFFDDPGRAADTPQKPEDAAKPSDPDAPQAEDPEQGGGAKGPERKGNKEERCVGSTDKVDREIEKLKKKQKELEQRINTETDEARIRDLERRLAQVERELRQKDNDTYRRQHSTFTQL